MSPVGSGLSGQLGVSEEVTWGTAVTPLTRWYEFVSFSPKHEVARIESAAIRANTSVMRSDDWAAGRQAVSVDIELELMTKNIALLMKHMFGTVATTGAGPYTHTFTMSTGNLTGKGMTVQGGLPSTDAVVQPLTLAGCKVASWEIAWDNEGLITFNLTLAGKSATTATAVGTAAYTSANALFSFTGASVSVAGSSVKVRSGSISGDNSLDLERFFSGQDTISEPLEAGMREYGGELEMDFESLTAYNRYVNGTEAALVIAFANGTNSVTFTANARFDGTTPDISGPDILTMTQPYKCVGSTTDASALTCVVVSSEVTP